MDHPGCLGWRAGLGDWLYGTAGGGDATEVSYTEPATS
jgi:hypothetical protein